MFLFPRRRSLPLDLTPSPAPRSASTASRTPSPHGPDRMARFMLDLPVLLPMERRRLTLEARFVDEAGGVTPEPPDTRTLEIVDPRPPKIIPTGPGILWTSRPGPAEEVELKLVFPGEPNARYRAYLADTAGLDLPTMEPGPPARTRLRAEIAVDGANRAGGGQLNGRRDRFRLLTEPALVAGADGQVMVDERLPRSLATVQFLRIVPLGATGAEADFDACGLTPVAVPSDRRPPAPLLAVAVDGGPAQQRSPSRLSASISRACGRPSPPSSKPRKVRASAGLSSACGAPAASTSIRPCRTRSRRAPRSSLCARGRARRDAA